MKSEPSRKIPEYELKSDGSFVIQNYNLAKPFANFFPGIAGKYGIPMWVFYVNRGQCIASFGIKDKDHALMEFFPANQAWQITPYRGFRSFIKISSNKKHAFYEPFYNGYTTWSHSCRNSMVITPFDLTLKEINLSLGLDLQINYFPIPSDCFAALARIVKIKNISRAKMRIQVLDGLPLIIPLGISNRILKQLGRTAEAWTRVKFIGNSAAFYKLDVDPADRPEVKYIQKGNFYVSFTRPIIDPWPIFGPRLNLDYPYSFLKQKNFKYPKNQTNESKLPSGMGLAEFELKPDEQKCLSSLFGNIHDAQLLHSRLPEIKTQRYLKLKREQNKNIISQLQDNITTQSSSTRFNFYCRQTYLDNTIRGGYPIVFKSKQDKKQVFYLYLRKHGDLERDYNNFQIQPRYFSQGNGNFRDIVQNRRSDTWFNPDIEAANLITFFNLIQTDGFNPLVVKGIQFHLKNKRDFKKICLRLFNAKDLDKLLSFLDNPFTPGSVIFFIEENNLCLKISRDEFLNILMTNSLIEEDAQHKQADDHGAGGFWIDHWTYCLDLLENYLELYPERLNKILFKINRFKFYDNLYVVRPRKEKYVVYENKIRQLDSIKLDNHKLKMQAQRPSQVHWLRTDKGCGKIYQTTLIEKLICIMVNKLASLDPFGCGIEMEANKPNWYDALNGLPALFGSSICETMELKRLICFIIDKLAQTKENSFLIFGELFDFMASLRKLLNAHNNISLNKDKAIDHNLIFWDKSCFLKEAYRNKTRAGINGRQRHLNKQALLDFLNQALKKVNTGIRKAFDRKNNLYCAYFINQVNDYKVRDGIIYPRQFRQIKLPLFLEAQVHALKIIEDKGSAQRLYQAIKKSQLH
ncbi:MAG: hypothetical protein PVI33_02720, partial [Candidatus Omnitrophota bacterium]